MNCVSSGLPPSVLMNTGLSRPKRSRSASTAAGLRRGSCIPDFAGSPGRIRNRKKLKVTTTAIVTNAQAIFRARNAPRPLIVLPLRSARAERRNDARPASAYSVGRSTVRLDRSSSPRVGSSSIQPVNVSVRHTSIVG